MDTAGDDYVPSVIYNFCETTECHARHFRVLRPINHSHRKDIIKS